MAAAWEAERDDREWSDREAWRGAEHLEDNESWRGESASAWEDEEETTFESEDSWHSDAPAADWPEDLAGPEYWLYKRDGM